MSWFQDERRPLDVHLVNLQTFTFFFLFDTLKSLHCRFSSSQSTPDTAPSHTKKA